MQIKVPRLHVHKLVYMLMGAALAAGLLVSFLVRPEPMLAAAQTCYSSCSSTTTLSMSSTRTTHGFESNLRFTVTVSAGSGGTGTPAGSVIVAAGATTLCSVHLSGGTGSCSPSDTALGPAGDFSVVANYAGDTIFNPSSSGQQTLTVVRDSTTWLSLSTHTVTFGHEQNLTFTVTVSGPNGLPMPTGRQQVTVVSNGQHLCGAALTNGIGSCRPSAKALPVGSHNIVARYLGDTLYNPSDSNHVNLTVKS